MLARLGCVAFVVVSWAACVPVQTQTVPAGVQTNIEKTTVTVKDAQGNVLRTEEKEMILQEYTAKEPVGLKTAVAPRVLHLKVEKGQTVEDKDAEDDDANTKGQ